VRHVFESASTPLRGSFDPASGPLRLLFESASSGLRPGFEYCSVILRRAPNVCRRNIEQGSKEPRSSHGKAPERPASLPEGLSGRCGFHPT
ncbi:hypothetical protein, partial [Parapedobacter lycopersici]|uniref:hypothetical protein n=1 Tax=Parapedobacter lycopersici TaxID=1864939 RepID=UPI003340311E